jgi:hypothetical protein
VPRSRRACRFAFLVFAALCPELAFALNERYEGLLQPDGRDRPIPIVVEVQEFGGVLKGKVKTSPPYKGDAPIESGSNVYGKCIVNVALSKSVTLRLDGSCEQTAFTGTYMLWDTQTRSVSRGNFHLPRKVPESGKLDTRHTTASASGPAGCLKANTQCLLACARVDANAQLMCSSRCRNKLRLCKEPPKAPPLDVDTH